MTMATLMKCIAFGENIRNQWPFLKESKIEQPVVALGSPCFSAVTIIIVKLHLKMAK
jgi:hypothetical protein